MAADDRETNVTRTAELEGDIDYEYEAFISYRHVPLDARIAKRIQRHVEGYRIPRQLRSPDGPKRLGKLFRDQDELPASSSLSQQIDHALRTSKYLIVVCGTKTNESAWVAQEIDRFVSYHGIDRVILALAEGASSEVVPQSLRTRKVLGDDGQWQEVRNDPLAADLRPALGKRFGQECLRIVAAIIGCGYDDLKQRQRTRRVRLAVALWTLISVFLILFSNHTWYQQKQILAHYRESQRRESEYLATESKDLLEKGARYEAIQVALEALPTSSGDPKRPYVAEAENALAAALEVYPSVSDWRTCYRIAEAPAGELVYDRAGLFAYFDRERNLCIADLRTGSVLTRIAVEDDLAPDFLTEQVPFIALAFSDAGLICVGPDMVGCYDTSDGTCLWKHKLPGADPLFQIAVSPDGSAAALVTKTRDGSDTADGSWQVVVLRSSDGSEIARFDLKPDSSEMQSIKMAFDDKGERLAVLGGGTCSVMHLATEEIVSTPVACDYPAQVLWLEDRIVAATSSNDTSYVELFDESLGRVWQWSAGNPSMYVSWGVLHEDVNVAGLWSLEDRTGTQLVVTCGQSLVLLDTASGEVVNQVERENPFVGAKVVQNKGTDVIISCLMNGEVSVLSPQTSTSSLAPGFDVLSQGTTMNVGEAQDAHLLACDDGLFLVVDDAMTHAAKVFEFSRGAEMMGIPVEGMWGADYLLPLSDGSCVVSNDECLAVLDTTFLEVQRTIEFETLDQLDAAQGVIVTVTPEQTLLVSGTATAEKGKGGDSREASVIYEIDPKTGETVFSTRLDGITFIDEPKAVTAGEDGARYAFAYSESELLLVPLDGNDDVWRYEFDGFVLRAWCTGNAIVWAGQDSSAGIAESESLGHADYRDKLFIIDPAERDARPKTGLDICDVILRDDEDMVSVSEDGSLLVAECIDSRMRAYDLSTGSLIWETGQLAEYATYVGFLPSSNKVLLQSDSGICAVFDISNGSVIARSRQPLSDILAVQERGAKGTILAEYTSPDWSSQGIMTLNIDAGTIGASRDVPNAVYVSDDESFVIVGSVFGVDVTYWKMPYYTLDELIEGARELMREHELDSSERSMYLLPANDLS